MSQSINSTTIYSSSSSLALPTSCRARNRPLRVALIGPRGAGKSTLAPQLAQALGLNCIDLDASIEHVLKEPLEAWIKRNGWTAFRRLESEALGRALQHNAVVVACGAGVVESNDNLALLTESNSQVLWLDIGINEQSKRLENDASRPRLEPDLSLEEELQRIDLRRRVLYQQIAKARVDADAAPEGVVKRCVAKLGDVNVGDRH